MSSLHRIDYTYNISHVIPFHYAAIKISLDPLTYLEEELTIDTYVILTGTTSASIREITEIRITDLGGGSATGMVGLSYNSVRLQCLYQI